jgi:hypothetical protein
MVFQTHFRFASFLFEQTCSSNKTVEQKRSLWGPLRVNNSVYNNNLFLEFASLIGLLWYSIWSRLWLSIKALVV